MKTISIIFLISGLARAFALDSTGTIEITGKGEMTAKPELFHLSVLVSSICYEKSRDAKEANALLATRLVSAAKGFARGERDKVTASGGTTVRQTEYIYPVGSSPKILCERGWRTSNSIGIEIADLAVVSELEEALLKEEESGAPNPAKVAQSFVELSSPNFLLYPETQKNMRLEAQKKAYVDAKTQLEAFKSSCVFKNLKLSKIFEPAFEMRSKYGAAEKATEIPLIPDMLSVEAVWKFTWEFDPASECFN